MDPDVSPIGLLRFSPDAPLKSTQATTYLRGFSGLMQFHGQLIKNLNNSMTSKEMAS